MRRWKDLLAKRVYGADVRLYVCAHRGADRLQLQRVEKPQRVARALRCDWYKNLFRNDMILQSAGRFACGGLCVGIIATVLGTLAGHRHQQHAAAAARAVMMNHQLCARRQPGNHHRRFADAAVRGAERQISKVLRHFWAQEVLVGFGMARCSLRTSRSACRMCMFNVSPKLRQMDVRMYEAALDLGCNPRQAFFKVVLPEIMPAIISAFLICLTYSIDDFIISLFHLRHGADAAHRHLLA